LKFGSAVYTPKTPRELFMVSSGHSYTDDGQSRDTTTTGSDIWTSLGLSSRDLDDYTKFLGKSSSVIELGELSNNLATNPSYRRVSRQME
jgi:hypothetical protein